MASGGVQVSFTVEGKAKVVRAVKREQKVQDDKLRKSVARSAFGIQRDARTAAVGDTGRLRQQINVYFKNTGLRADVRADAPHSPFVEFGTGPLGARTHSGPLPQGYSHSASHELPPTTALAGWARRHGADPWAVAVAIKKRGGNPAKPFLGPAFRAWVRIFLTDIRKQRRG